MNLIYSHIRQYGAIAALVLFIVYFLLAALQGDTGLFRLYQINAQIDAATVEHNHLLEERTTLDNLTKRLSDNYLDLDLLDEQARKRLGLVRADEIIIR